MEKYVVSRDDTIYEAWPDVVLTDSGKLICVFRECAHHQDGDFSHLVMCESTDKGRTWSKKKDINKFEDISKIWNCPKISKTSDGTLIILCDLDIFGDNSFSYQIYMYKSVDDGETWTGPEAIPAYGICPDQLIETKTGRWIIAYHSCESDAEHNVSYVSYSDDKGKTWSEGKEMIENANMDLHEPTVLELSDGTLVCYFRIDTHTKMRGMKAFSYDNGETWIDFCETNLPGLHRPIAHKLKSGNIFLTFRLAHGSWKGKWGFQSQIFAAALMSEESCKATELENQNVRIMPLDFDRNEEPDLGYSGIAQFDDGEIYIVNYIMDDAPKAQIRGYSLREDEFVQFKADRTKKR